MSNHYFVLVFWGAVTQGALACTAHRQGRVMSPRPAPRYVSTVYRQQRGSACLGLPGTWGSPRKGQPPPSPWDPTGREKQASARGTVSSSEEGRVIKRKSHKCCILLGVLPARRRSIISGLWTAYPRTLPEPVTPHWFVSASPAPGPASGAWSAVMDGTGRCSRRGQSPLCVCRPPRGLTRCRR